MYFIKTFQTIESNTQHPQNNRKSNYMTIVFSLLDEYIEEKTIQVPQGFFGWTVMVWQERFGFQFPKQKCFLTFLDEAELVSRHKSKKKHKQWSTDQRHSIFHILMKNVMATIILVDQHLSLFYPLHQVFMQEPLSCSRISTIEPSAFFQPTCM